MRKLFLFIVCLLFFIYGSNHALAALEVTYITDIFVDTPTISKGYTVKSEDGNFYVGIRPEVLAVETRVVVKQYDKNQFDFPEGWQAVTNVYEFDIFNKDAFKNEKPLIIRFQAEEPTKQLKKVFFWNGVIEEWVELPSETKDYTVVDSVLHLPYAKMVVLENIEKIGIGDASWYKYRDCLCAASPDYPKGSKLLVKDLDTKKEVVVTVNDYGPDRSIFPNRVIDLDKVAFSKLGPPSWGVLRNILVSQIQ